jgi:hypothetical protein
MQHTNRNNLIEQHFEWVLTVVAMIIPIATVFSMLP